METFKISVDVNINFSESVKAFLQNVFSTNQPRVATTVVEKPVAEAPKVAKPVAEAPKVAKPVAEAPKVAKPVAEAPKATVRKILAGKIAEHREEIKEKLNELGAPSVTRLDPSKYVEMIDFLESL